MHVTVMGFVFLLIVAGICGALGRAIGGGTRGGFFVSIAVGFVGAALGSALAHALQLPELWTMVIDGQPYPVVWSVFGAAVFVAVIHLISGARGAPRG